jgi:hypothetical protein
MFLIAVTGNKKFKEGSPPNFLKIIPKACWIYTHWILRRIGIKFLPVMLIIMLIIMIRI